MGIDAREVQRMVNTLQAVTALCSIVFVAALMAAFVKPDAATTSLILAGVCVLCAGLFAGVMWAAPTITEADEKTYIDA